MGVGKRVKIQTAGRKKKKSEAPNALMIITPFNRRKRLPQQSRPIAAQLKHSGLILIISFFKEEGFKSTLE